MEEVDKERKVSSVCISPTRLILIVMNLDEEVRPYTTSAEREKTENLATLYSIIVSLEYLERAYVRDSVTGKEYVQVHIAIRLLTLESVGLS